MFDMVNDIIKQLLRSLSIIETRFVEIKSPDDFVMSESGMLLLDAISMRLQVVGELIKKIDKNDNTILGKYPQINWKQIMRLRDLISHHYENIDHEIIYDICKNHIGRLFDALTEIQKTMNDA